MTPEVLVLVIVVGIAAYVIGRGAGMTAERKRAQGDMPFVRPPLIKRDGPAQGRGRSLSRFQNIAPKDMFSHLELSDRRDIDNYLAAGKKLAAIKLMRAAAGIGLKDAKDAVKARKTNQNG